MMINDYIITVHSKCRVCRELTKKFCKTASLIWQFLAGLKPVQRAILRKKSGSIFCRLKRLHVHSKKKYKMWTCPKCERELKHPNQWHNCVKISINSLFEGKAEELAYVFDKLLAEIMEWEHVAVSATQNCIVFVHNQTFLVIRPMKKELDLKFFSVTEQDERPVIKSIFYSGRYSNHIRIAALDELTKTVYTLIKKSYKLL